uniref:Sm domain-containing protein n=1 Tax=Sciurus vulgaris TaxID=55149 RepID=A0A8D2DWN7_SCIVU
MSPFAPLSPSPVLRPRAFSPQYPTLSFLAQPAVRGTSTMLFYSFFKSFVGQAVVVELKNDLSICGILHSMDQYPNIKLTDSSVTDPENILTLSVKNCFLRGSVVHYLLQDTARKEALQQKQWSLLLFPSLLYWLPQNLISPQYLKCLVFFKIVFFFLKVFSE